MHSISPYKISGPTNACEELEAVLHWRGKHALAIKERNELRDKLVKEEQAYNRLIDHTNECEKFLDEASELLKEIVKSGQAYRECTDRGSETGQRIAAVSTYVAQFQPEPHPPELTDAEPIRDADWHMHPCTQGHWDVGAAGGIAHCYQCDEKIVAATTTEAFEQWNATHPSSAKPEVAP